MTAKTMAAYINSNNESSWRNNNVSWQRSSSNGENNEMASSAVKAAMA
jgi:hypothetical protein